MNVSIYSIKHDNFDEFKNVLIDEIRHCRREYNKIPDFDFTDISKCLIDIISFCRKNLDFLLSDIDLCKLLMEVYDKCWLAMDRDLIYTLDDKYIDDYELNDGIVCIPVMKIILEQICRDKEIPFLEIYDQNTIKAVHDLYNEGSRSMIDIDRKGTVTLSIGNNHHMGANDAPLLYYVAMYINDYNKTHMRVIDENKINRDTSDLITVLRQLQKFENDSFADKCRPIVDKLLDETICDLEYAYTRHNSLSALKTLIVSTWNPQYILIALDLIENGRCFSVKIDAPKVDETYYNKYVNTVKDYSELMEAFGPDHPLYETFYVEIPENNELLDALKRKIKENDEIIATHEHILPLFMDLSVNGNDYRRQYFTLENVLYKINKVIGRLREEHKYIPNIGEAYIEAMKDFNTKK